MAIQIERYDKATAFDAECAATISAGQLVGYDANGKLVLADADAGTPIEAVGVALVDGVSGGIIGVAQIATLYNSAWSFSIGSSGKLWTSGTAGGMTQTKPASNGNMVQPVGHARTATRVHVMITPALAIVQSPAATSTVAFK